MLSDASPMKEELKKLQYDWEQRRSEEARRSFYESEESPMRNFVRSIDQNDLVEGLIAVGKKIFLAYHEADESYVKALKDHLRPLLNTGLVREIWEREEYIYVKNPSGYYEKMAKNLEESDVVIELRSIDFFADDGLYQQSLQARRLGKYFIPLILRYYDWTLDDSISGIDVYPQQDDAVLPLEAWKNQNEAFVQVATVVRDLAEKGLPDQEVLQDVSPSKEGVKVFLNYSRKNLNFAEELKKHLRLLTRKGWITEIWDDTQIPLGSNYQEETLQHLEESDLVIELRSADFLVSEYAEESSRKAVALDKERIPIVISPYPYDMDDSVKNIQLGPQIEGTVRPIDEWEFNGEPYVGLIRGIIDRIDILSKDSSAEEPFSSSKATTWFLGIGISKHLQLPDIRNAVNDVLEMQRTLEEKYELDESTLLFDEEATTENILKNFDELLDRVGPADQVLIYYCGHTELDESRDRGYWLPFDAEANRRSSYLDNNTIIDYIRNISCKDLLLIVDGVFSGALFESGRGSTAQSYTEPSAGVSRWGLVSGQDKGTVGDGSAGSV
jgi:hypothetical protein